MTLPKPLLLCLTLSVYSRYISEVSALQGDSWCGDFMCVDASVNQSTVIYTMRSLNQLGWMAIGFGTRMQDSSMVILWPNANGSVTLSQRQAPGEVEPLPDSSPTRRARLVPQDYSPDVIPTLAFEIAQSNDTVQQLIWAFGITPPDPDPSANIEQHLDAGQFSLNLTKILDNSDATPSPSSSLLPAPATSSVLPPPVDSDPSSPPQFVHPSRNSSLLKAHAVLSSIGFLVILPLAALVARWSRTITARWVSVHWFITLVLGLPFATIGWVLGPLAVAQRRSAHMVSLHQVRRRCFVAANIHWTESEFDGQICGVILYPLLLMQISSGIFVSVRHVKDGRTHPPRNVLHVILGLVILSLSVVDGFTGAKSYATLSSTSTTTTATAISTACIVWAAIWGTSYLVGLYLLPRQFAHERLGWTSPSYLANPAALRAASTRHEPEVVAADAHHSVELDGLNVEQEVMPPAGLSGTEMREVQAILPVSVRMCYPQT
ncbi:hypothetical protein CERSUDRAFT_135562 [Gelatoporia subvermispora B]|uniref:DOMON domain-containing protein n=1 Tax=Ceriporiopsis subvermispora (strain B) TaxID=914234 RepID=M2R277_CERS8|nr:hypothetical protein CERSUDRAFT_135562 [Gelatoporia subvermispora B]